MGEPYRVIGTLYIFDYETMFNVIVMHSTISSHGEQKRHMTKPTFRKLQRPTVSKKYRAVSRKKPYPL